MIFTLTRLVHCGAIITVLDVTPVDEYEFMLQTSIKEVIIVERLTDNFGTARWADESDLLKEGLFPLALTDYVKYSPPEAQQQWVRGNKRAAAFLLGQMADPKKLLEPIRQNRESAMESMLSSLGRLFSKHKDDYLAWNGDGHIHRNYALWQGGRTCRAESNPLSGICHRGRSQGGKLRDYGAPS